MIERARVPVGIALAALMVCAPAHAQPGEGAAPIRLVTIAPAHFHAALVQRERLPGVSDTVHVYADLGWDLAEHVKRIAAFNQRAVDPTRWALEIHAGPDHLARLRRDRAGNVAIISGRNRDKLARIEAALDAGMHVLCDKPWIIEPEELPGLRALMARAERERRVVLDIMTERFEATNALLLALVETPGVIGPIAPGAPDAPSIYIEDVHHYWKEVAGRPNLRPPWFFDSAEQGEGIADTGTHLVDLVQAMVAPGRVLGDDEIDVLSARRWPTKVTLAAFQQVTGLAEVPASMQAQVRAGALWPLANTYAVYRAAGVHVAIAAMWDWRARPGAGDWKYVVVRGTRARVEIRQGPRERFRPELYVIPAVNRRAEIDALAQALAERLAELGGRFPGVQVVPRGAELRLDIPDALRTGHEAHFSEVARRFLGYVARPDELPGWENGATLAKYLTTSRITARSRADGGSVGRALQRKAP